MSKYSDEFRTAAIALAEELGLTEAARRLGVSYQTLWNWMNPGKDRERKARQRAANPGAHREARARQRLDSPDRHALTTHVGNVAHRLRRDWNTATPQELLAVIRANAEGMYANWNADDYRGQLELDHIEAIGVAACRSAERRCLPEPGFEGPNDPDLLRVLSGANLLWRTKADHRQKTTQDRADVARMRAELERRFGVRKAA